MRFDPRMALEGAFLGFPFKISRARTEGGRRGPLHQYPDRDEPYFEDLGREARRYDLTLYFVGPDADTTAELFDALLWKGREGTLVLPGLRRERMKAVKWSSDRESGRGNWVSFQVSFVEPGRNQYPAATQSWPHRLLDAALDARTAFGDALADALDLEGLSQEAAEALGTSAADLAFVLDGLAQVASGDAPSSAIALAGVLTTEFLQSYGSLPFDTIGLAAATVGLVGSWAEALAGDRPDTGSRSRAIDGLFGLYDQAAGDQWFATGALTMLEQAAIDNQAAFSAGIRRTALAEAARLAAAIEFSSYNDAVRLRERFADAFDDEVHRAGQDAAVRGHLMTLQAATLAAISAAGADKAKLVPYAISRPRPALVLAQLWYGDDGDAPGRAAELVARTGAVHPAFVPATGERLSR